MSTDTKTTGIEKPEFHLQKHQKYLLNLHQSNLKWLQVHLQASQFENNVESFLTLPFAMDQLYAEPNRLDGLYWGVMALDLLKCPLPLTVSPDSSTLTKDIYISWILACQTPEGGFGHSYGMDAHLMSTHHAILLLILLKALHFINIDKIVQWISTLQLPDGSFKGDTWGERDTRFAYCALSSLRLLGHLEAINAPLTASFLLNCLNSDGGFAWLPGGESHAASSFCCLAGLAITKNLSKIDREKVGFWLAQRQTPGGGFNGRPEKSPDVCYSWWIAASLEIISSLHWIDATLLQGFIYRSQDNKSGGIADRPGDTPDVFHTYFGVAGLSLLSAPENLKKMHPVYALPLDTITYIQNHLQKKEQERLHEIENWWLFP